MIGELADAVAADLKARKYPLPVYVAPERMTRGGFSHAVVFARDTARADALAAPLAANQKNPESPFNRVVAGAVRVFTFDPRAGSRPRDHMNACDLACDAVITAMYRICKAKRLPLAFVDSRILSAEECGLANGEAFPGAAAEIRFSVTTLVRDVTYKGEGLPTGAASDVALPVVTSPGNPDLDVEAL